MAASDLDEATGLPVPFGQPQPEMGCNEAKGAKCGAHLGLDRAPRFASTHCEVVNFGRAERPPAHHHLAVIPVGGADRLCVDTMLSDRFAQDIESGPLSRGAAARIDLLKRNDVGLVTRDRFGDTGQSQSAVYPAAAMNVPSHDANDGR